MTGSRLGLYILAGHEPVRVDDLIKWMRWYEVADRGVASTVIGDTRVSTVFLGIDHRWAFGPPAPPIKPPLVFETAVLREDADTVISGRCCTWAEAEAMHARVVAEVSGPH